MESGKTAAGVVLGIGIGALLGVLFAPAKGSKTRKRIMNKSQGYANDLKDKFDGLYEDVTGKYETLVEDAKNVVNSK
jgi:gas vesicle protein